MTIDQKIYWPLEVLAIFQLWAEFDIKGSQKGKGNQSRYGRAQVHGKIKKCILSSLKVTFFYVPP